MSSLVGLGFAVMATVGLAAQALTVRRGSDSYRILDVLTVVFAVNLLVLVPAAALVVAPPYSLTWRALAAFALAGLLGSLVARTCYYVGIDRLGASRAEPLKALLPLFAVGGAILMLGERLTPVLFGGVLLLVIGGLAVVVEARENPITATGRQLRIDVVFPVMAALLYGVDPIFTKIGLEEGTSPLAGLAIRIVASACGFGAYLLWRTARTGRLQSLVTDRWLVVAGIANTGYLLAYYAALAQAPVVLVAPIIGTSTLLVVGGSAAFLGDERVTWQLAGAAVLVVAGVALIVQG